MAIVHNGAHALSYCSSSSKRRWSIGFMGVLCRTSPKDSELLQRHVIHWFHACSEPNSCKGLWTPPELWNTGNMRVMGWGFIMVHYELFQKCSGTPCLWPFWAELLRNTQNLYKMARKHWHYERYEHFHNGQQKCSVMNPSESPEQLKTRPLWVLWT